MTKFVFVTGGVVSSLGKGIAAASLAAILESRRSEERRVGKECRRLCRSRWSPYH
jgi:hypothetical protein